MSRPHVEFIFAQVLDWREQFILPGREGLSAKILSADDRLEEVTALVRFPPGWAMGLTTGLQEELYVLDGDLALGGQMLGRDGYFRIAAGSTCDWWSQKGAVALVFLNSGAATDSDPLVAIDTSTLDWDRSDIPKELDFMGLARKPLFVDADDGRHRTWLLAVSPQISPRGASLAVETHSCAEEVYMISGDITGPQGQMTPGAYFWRPCGIAHGPFGSRNGGLALSRFRHGPQETQFHSQIKPFDFDAPYRPDLPDSLRHLAEASPADPSRY